MPNISRITCILLLMVNISTPTVYPVQRLRDSWGQVRDSWAQLRNFVGGSANPCYRRRRTQPSAESCEDIVLPNGFCDICGINKDVNSDGTYDNCLYTSDVETIGGAINMQCLDMMDIYINMNPCDTQRATGLRRYRDMLWLPNGLRRLRSKHRQTLDSFVYAVCEAACDCIPQYNASIDERAYDVHRGNCQGHLYHDVCQVYPNIKVIRGENGSSTIAKTSDLSTVSRVCPAISDWRAKHPGEWVDLTPTSVDATSHSFIDGLVEATGLISSANDTLWRSCFAMETTQKRIFPR